MVVSQFEPADFRGAKTELADEVLYVGYQIQEQEVDMVDTIADLRSLATRLENLYIAEVLSRRKLVVAQ